MLVAKPAIIHHKEFASHQGYVCHHLLHILLINVEINTFPTVQQYLAGLVSIGQFMFPSPFMEITACAAQSLFRVGERQRGSTEYLAFFQPEGSTFLIHTSKEVVIIAVIRIDFQPIVTGIAKGCADS